MSSSPSRLARLLSAPVQDVAILAVLGGIAFAAFHDTFVGWTYLIPALVGLLLGGAVAVGVLRWRLPLVTIVPLLALVYLLLGGLVALHGLGAARMAPGPATLRELARLLVHGWKEFVTTVPPLDPDELLVIPWILGLVAGALGVVLCLRVRTPVPAVLVPLALLGAVIALGVAVPGRMLVPGGLVALGSLAWVMARARRAREWTASSATRRLSRRLAAAALCLGAVAAGVLGSSHLPGTAAQPLVLRTKVVPPFDISQYPTPLASFRRFTQNYATENPSSGLFDKHLFTVTGDGCDGQPVRLAALDSYDGHVWGAGTISGSAGEPLSATAADTFQEVGSVIPNPATGKAVSCKVTVGDANSTSEALGGGWVWVPTVGALTGIDFPDSGQSDAFRYDISSGTGVLANGVAPGTTYSFTAVVGATALTADTPLSPGSLVAVNGQAVSNRITPWGGSEGSPYDKLLAIAHYLANKGGYTDGEGEFAATYPAGHSDYRLATGPLPFAQYPNGDDEQYAAMMGLLGNDLGIATRVVMGVEKLPAGGEVTGKDIHAWIEVQAADGTWRMMPHTEFMVMRPPQKQDPPTDENVPATVIPPPAPVHPPATAGQSLDANVPARGKGNTHPGLHLPTWAVVLLKGVGIPVGLLLAIAAVILGLKVLRRRRRRSRGHPARRLAAGWSELLDTLRDYGHRLPHGMTRREQAALVGLEPVQVQAWRADVVMFGRDQPTDDVVAEFWSQTDELRRELASGHSRWQRIKAALNVATLRPRRRA